MDNDHVHILNLRDLKTIDDKVSYIQRHKNCEVFIDLILISCSFDYKFDTMNFKLNPINIPATKFNKIQHNKFKKLAKVLYSDVKEQQVAFSELLNTFSDFNKEVYKTVLNRALGVTINMLYSSGAIKNTNKLEVVQDYGIPSMSCIVMDTDITKTPLYVSRTKLGTIVTTLDGIPLEITDDMYRDLEDLHIPINHKLKGYISNNKFYITNYYIDNVTLSERILFINRLLETKHTTTLSMVSMVTVYDTNNLKVFVKSSKFTPISYQDVPPNYARNSHHIINLQFLKDVL